MAFMYDADGNRVDPKTLQAPQSDQAAYAQQLRREFANHPSRGLTPSRLADIMERAEQGDLLAQAELFQDMEEKDGHIQAEMHKRKMAVTQLDWSLQPLKDASAKEKKTAAALEERINDMLDVEDLLFDALDGIGHGYACLELEWRQDNIGWFPKIHYRDPAWFTIDPARKNEIRLRDSSNAYGVALTPFGWIAHTHKSRSGYLARTGLHRALAWPYLFKNYSVRDLAELLEIYGLPIRLGKYPSGASEKEKNTLMNAVLSIGHHAGGIIPDGMAMDFITATSSGSSDPFKAMIDWCEATQSKVILGGTLTSQTGANGNRALGDVHNEVRLDIRNNDAKQMATTLNRYLVYPLCMLNGLTADNRCPQWVFDTQEPDDLALYSDALPKLVAIGAKIPASYLHEKLKIPAPEGDEDVLSVTPNQSAGVVDKTQPAATSAATATIVDDTDPSPVTAYADSLANEAGGALKAVIDNVRQAALNAQSLEALRDDVLQLYGDVSTEELRNIMVIAFATADLAGRFDVHKEAINN